MVEAYDLLKAIYLERGYRGRDIPKHILEKNLYGLDIDERAAQMAAFALMMKARADDRRIFERDITLNVQYLQSSAGLDAELLGLNCQNIWMQHYDEREIIVLLSISKIFEVNFRIFSHNNGCYKTKTLLNKLINYLRGYLNYWSSFWGVL